MSGFQTLLNYSTAALYAVRMGSAESYGSIDHGQRWEALDIDCI